jgi:exopolysaccharide biosynthesis polyprenyl glycosylphosphotransferase
LDVVLAGLGLLVLSPFLLLIALLVKLDSPGPVLFRQRRVGLNGREFWMYKFRSMVIDAEEQLETLKALNEVKDGITFKMANDPRMTRLGRLLRKTSLDEFPQLFNVLKGEMSLVGPRPPLPKEVVLYTPEQKRRLSVVPGCTGLWQISGRSTTTFQRMIELDLEYIRTWSLPRDIFILFNTIRVILKMEGSY